MTDKALMVISGSLMILSIVMLLQLPASVWQSLGDALGGFVAGINSRVLATVCLVLMLGLGVRNFIRP